LRSTIRRKVEERYESGGINTDDAAVCGDEEGV
jgi:hypothetical protein